MSDTEPVPTIDDVLRNFAKRVEQIPRGKTYGWSEEKRQIERICASERLDELQHVGHRPGGYDIVAKGGVDIEVREAELQTQLEGETK